MNRFGKYFLLATGFALLATFARIPGAVINVHAHDRACSVASLKGTYAWRRSGVHLAHLTDSGILSGNVRRMYTGHMDGAPNHKVVAKRVSDGS